MKADNAVWIRVGLFALTVAAIYGGLVTWAVKSSPPYDVCVDWSRKLAEQLEAVTTCYNDPLCTLHSSDLMRWADLKEQRARVCAGLSPEPWGYSDQQLPSIPLELPLTGTGPWGGWRHFSSPQSGETP